MWKVKIVGGNLAAQLIGRCLWRLWELHTWQLKKTHEHRQNIRELRKHLHQFDNICTAFRKCAANSDNTETCCNYNKRRLKCLKVMNTSGLGKKIWSYSTGCFCAALGQSAGFVFDWGFLYNTHLSNLTQPNLSHAQLLDIKNPDSLYHNLADQQNTIRFL